MAGRRKNKSIQGSKAKLPCEKCGDKAIEEKEMKSLDIKVTWEKRLCWSCVKDACYLLVIAAHQIVKDREPEG